MSDDLTELRRVGRVLDEARALLESERKRLGLQQGPRSSRDGTAGSAAQTLLGAGELSDGVNSALKWVALAAGYSAIGLDRRADHALGMARMKPVGFPFGADRMSRPLGEDTVRAMELVRDLDFFPGEVGIAVDVALAAPQATYPPASWDLDLQQQRGRSDRP
ncbi:hypothetical protein ACFT9I_31275 [Streptomyces sp. NPDC057137]|uniref:hypothetical protein n=1 Tax=Streptomyces sp. NPDC057137 TaxID=3346030 RepID=UPI00362EB727